MSVIMLVLCLENGKATVRDRTAAMAARPGEAPACLFCRAASGCYAHLTGGMADWAKSACRCALGSSIRIQLQSSKLCMCTMKHCAAQDKADSDVPLSKRCRCVRQAWTVPTDDGAAASVVKDIRDMHKAFQTFLGFLFAATFAATVALQGNLTDVDPTSYWNLTYWEKASRTGYGYLAFYSQDAACMSIRDPCWQAFQTRDTSAVVWESRQDCSGCSQWTDSHDFSSIKNFLSAPYTRQHTLFLQWLGATLSLSAMALLIGAILNLLPLRPLSVVVACMRLVVVLTAFAILAAFHTVKQSLYINYAHDHHHREETRPGVTAVFVFVWTLAIVLIVCSLVWNPVLHVKSQPPSSKQSSSAEQLNRGP